MGNEKLELIIGKNLADVLVDNEASYLIENIRKLRKESKHPIPLVHITDEIEINENSYEIRDFDKTTLKQVTPKNKELCNLTKDIIKNLSEICEVKQ